MSPPGTTEVKRVLIANRGEIALRIVRACRDAGVASIAVYAGPDEGAPYTVLADEAVSLAGTGPADTYLSAGKLLAVAEQAGADSVHPGYGFLAENADFAQAVLEAGLTWIGPPPDVIRVLGDKVRARAVAAQAGAPLVPGTSQPGADPAEAMRFAERHGLPLAIKAAHGGGGRGLRIARATSEIAAQFDAAVREAQAVFGRGECFVEAYVERGRHVEAQVLADTYGQVLVAGTRDCTLQRRYQKLVEEAPAPFLTDDQRDVLEHSAAAICRAAGYVSAGTVEFLLSAAGELSFLEVNTRLQVEHSATEETIDVDLVRAQLLIAAGGTPPVRAAEVPLHGVDESAVGCLVGRQAGHPVAPAFAPSGGIQQVAGGRLDMPGVDARRRQELPAGARTGHLPDGQVGDPQLLRPGAQQGIVHRGAQSALGMVVLGHDEAAVRDRCRGHEGLGVDGLDGVQVDDPGVDVVGRRDDPRRPGRRAR